MKTRERLISTFESVLGFSVGVQELQAANTEQWDSLTHIKILLEIEKNFNVEIPSEDVLLLYSSVSEILDYLQSKHPHLSE